MATHGFKTGNAFCRLNSKVSTEGPIITLIDITDDEATVFLNIQEASLLLLRQDPSVGGLSTATKLR
jgi:hypothetical protein